jgi:hypothetical protein
MIASSKSPFVIALCVLDAALILASGLIHLHLWLGKHGYRHNTVGHINDLFLLQVIGCFVLTIALLAMRDVLAALAGAALVGGTLVGYLISHNRAAGLFGWHDGYPITGYTLWAIIVEVAGTALLLITAVVIARGAKTATA